MSAITVENLGKRYVLGRQMRHDTLRDSLVHGARTLLGSLGRSKPAPTDEFWALRDVSFKVEPGEVVGIIGRNGAGKSTLLKILSRITEPTTGRITLKGRVASLLEVGTGFHPELTGRENIYLNGAILGMSRAEIRSKFDEIVAFSEVERFLDTPVKRYSSGMYVRLAFAVAAHLDPEILIVDEVLAVGDQQFQQKCLGKMRQVASSEGRTVLFVSHNLSAVLSLCTRGLMLDKGTLVASGNMEGVANHYLSEGAPSIGKYTKPVGSPQLLASIWSVELINSDGRPISCVDNGRPFSVIIVYQMSNGASFALTPSISVRNTLGVNLFHHHARLNKQVIKSPPRHGKIAFNMVKLPLPAGKYYLSVCLVAEHEGRIVDQVENALEFEVIDGSFYAPGESTPASHGAVLVEGDWSFAAV